MPTISTLTVDIESRTSGFSRGLKVAIGGLATLATGAAYAFGKFEESENVMQQTNAVIKSTGGIANVTAKDVDKLSSSLSKKTGVDDEVIASGENMLLTFKNIRNETGANNDIFTQTTKATLDMAAGMAAASGGEIDLKSASIQMGKALNDPIAGMSALSRVGVTFTEDQKKQITQLVKHNHLLGAQKIILAEVTSEFQGSAKASKTTAGTMSVALENLAETIGGLLAPAIRVAADGLNRIIAAVQKNAVPAWKAFQEGVAKAWKAVKPFAEAIGSVLLPLLETAWHTIQDRILPVLSRLKPLFIVIGAAIVLFATVTIAQFALVVTAVGFLIDKFLDLVGFIRDQVVEPIVNTLARIGDFVGKIAGWVKDRFLSAWQAVRGPVLATLHAIEAALGAVVRSVARAVGWVKDRLLGAWQTIKGPVTAVIGFIAARVGTIVNWVQRAYTWIKDKLVAAWNAVKAPAVAVWNAIKTAASAALNVIITMLNGVIHGINGVLNGLDVISGPTINYGEIPSIPHVDTGGWVARSGLAVIHKGETVTPGGAGMPGTLVVRLDRRRFVDAYDYDERYRGF